MPNTGTRNNPPAHSNTSSIAERADFNIVRYANCWEDAQILCRALEPTPGKTILSIASAGDNSLSLLARGASVVAADISPAQLACLELRKTAIARLDYSDCLAFLGLHAHDKRLSTYRQLRRELEPQARCFWDNHPEAISIGIIHAGKFERYFRLFRQWILPLIHQRETVAQLLQSRSREQRIGFYNSIWNNRRWRWLFRLFFSRPLMGRLGRDPEFFRYVQSDITSHLLKRTCYALTELDTSDNPYLAYILSGNYAKALPDYLQPAIYDQVRANLSSLTCVLASVEDAALRFGPFDGFNLSDIFEYIDINGGTEIYRRLLNHARPGARLAYWNLLAPRACPEALRHRTRFLDALSEELFKKDRAFFYSRFIVEEVI